MQPILHSVSYAGLWGQEQLNLERWIPHAAQLGFPGVMLMTKRPHLSALDYDLDKTRSLAGLLQKHRLCVPCLAGYNDPGVGHSAGSGPFAPFSEMQLITVRHWAEMAGILGASILRLFTGPVNDTESIAVQWNRSVSFLRQACDIAAPFGVTIGVQNHDDLAAHYLSLGDLIDEIDRPNCGACFDAWSVALQGDDLAQAVRHMGKRIVHTTIADYVLRPRFRYHHPGRGNCYERLLDEVKAVPVGEGFIDYVSFLNALREIGYTGAVAFEMCSPLRGGGGLANLDAYASRFLDFMKPWS